jgi:FtsX-like permease family
MLAPWQHPGALVINRAMRSTADAPAAQTPSGSRGVRLAWFRFGAYGPQRWSAYLYLVLLVGLVGGVALGSVAAARRTQSAFPAFLVSTNPSDLDIDNGTYNPKLLAKVRALPNVTSVQSYVSLNILPIKPDGSLDFANPFGNLEEAGTLSNLYIRQDKLTIVAGRMLDPHLRDQVVVSKFAADTFGLHVGQKELVGIFPNSDFNNEGLPNGRAPRRLTLTIVGIGVFNDEVVQDDVDRIPRVLLSPELARPLAICCGTYAWTGIQVRHGAAHVQAVLKEYLSHLPAGTLPYVHLTSVVEEQGEQAVRPLSLALGVFGVIAGLAALVIGSQSISRLVRRSSSDREVLRALGGGPADTTADGLLGILAAVALGALCACGVAIAMSPLAPLGPVRAVVPAPGVAFDWTVLGIGTGALFGVLAGVAVLSSWWDAPHRRSRRQPGAVRSSVLVEKAAATRLPTAVVTGIGFALEPGRGRTAVPVRSAIFGTVVAVVVLVSALTFGNSLDALVSHPSLYGWNWDYSLTANAGYGDIPLAAARAGFARDPSVSAWAGGYYSVLPVDGQEVPVLGWYPNAALGLSMLSGHGLQTSDQVVLGAETLHDLGKKLGDTVVVTSGSARRTLSIVGTATMPTVGVGHGLHLSMGTGAVLDYELIPALDRNIQQETAFSGPNVIFARFRPGARSAAALQALEKVVDGLNAATGGHGNVLLSGPEHPGQIVDYRAMGETPAFLAAGLGLGAVSALGLTLAASVRRRWRDLALLKALGFTRGQLATAVAWQASVSVVIGTAIGIPAGLLLGRWLWGVFADELYAVPRASVPAWSIVAVGVGALVMANVVALLPARRAARVPTALVLRSE